MSRRIERLNDLIREKIMVAFIDRYYHDCYIRLNLGVEKWDDIEAFRKAKEPWLWKFLELPYGIPSHDTFALTYRLNIIAFLHGLL